MCTSFRLRAADGSIVIGRTMEFGLDLASELLVVPTGTPFTSVAPPEADALSWTTRFGFVGMNALGAPQACDGMNEAGLGIGSLYFPGFVGYQDPGDGPHIAPEDVCGWLLGTCATVGEAVEALRGVRTWSHIAPPLGAPLPLHFTLHDRSGASAVCEHVEGELRVHDNPFGVMTNSPPFDWHLINLRNFVNLSVTNVAPLDLEGATLAPLGQGSGLLGIPGDWTPPSRFVRAVALAHGIDTPADGPAAVLGAVHLLSVLDIPRGLVRDRATDGGEEDSTEWSTVADLTSGRYLVRTYDDPRIREVDLAAMLAAIDGPQVVPAGDPAGGWTMPVGAGDTRAIDPAIRAY